MDEPILSGKKVVSYAVLGAVLIIVGIFLHYLPARYVEKKDAGQKIKSEYTGLELAKKLEVFISSLEAKNNGTYFVGAECKKNAGCWPGVSSDSGSWIEPLGYLALYDATRDEKYKKIADILLNNGINEACAKNSPSSSCFDYALPLAVFFESTGDSQYKQRARVLRPHVDLILDEKAELRLDDEFMRSSRLAYFFYLTREEKYRIAATRRFEAAQKKLAANAGFLYGCASLLTTADFYRVFSDAKYLQDAEKFIQKENFHGRAEEMAFSLELAFCIDGYQSLFELTGNAFYEDGLKVFAKNLMATFMDHSRNKYYMGDFVILNYGGWHEENKKDRGLNARFMKIFAKMKDNKFSL